MCIAITKNKMSKVTVLMYGNIPVTFKTKAKDLYNLDNEDTNTRKVILFCFFGASTGVTISASLQCQLF